MQFTVHGPGVLAVTSHVSPTFQPGKGLALSP